MMIQEANLSMLSFVQRAAAAARAGNKGEAQRFLAMEVVKRPRNANAWWLWSNSNISEGVEYRAIYLRQVLLLTPNDPKARFELEKLKNAVDRNVLLSYDAQTKHPSGIDRAAYEMAVWTAKHGTLPPIGRTQNKESEAQAPTADDQTAADPKPASRRFRFPLFTPTLTRKSFTPVTAAKTSEGVVKDARPTNGAIQTPKLQQADLEDIDLRLRQPVQSDAVAAAELSFATTAGNATNAQLSIPWLDFGFRTLDRAGDQDNRIYVAVAYLVGLTLAEVVTVYLDPRLGVFVHMALMLIMMVHTVRRWEYPDHRLWFSLTLMPLIRIISLSLPLINFPLFYWFLYTSVPIFAGAIMAMRLLGISWRDAGITTKGLPLQLLIGLLGIALGYIEYHILRPEPLISELTWQQLWWPALIILISTGLLEELVFRGIAQNTAVEQLGAAVGVVYIAVYFAVLHIGYKSLTDVIFVLVVGLLFGWIVLRTKSIIGVTIAHGLTNIFLFLVIPLVANSL